MHARTGKLFGVAVASAAIMVAGTTVLAHAEPETPSSPIAEPQGPACDATVKSVPSGPGSLRGLQKAQSSVALASIPEISTFSEAVSGRLNPEVNVAAVLDNGPYVVFAPTNEAFEKLTPEQLETYKTDPAAMTSLVYYHMALGILGPDDIEGTFNTQQGKPVAVKGSGGDITVNDAKVVCGGIASDHMRIYMLDTVLDPDSAPDPISPSGTATTSTSATEATETTESSEASETVTVTETTEAEAAAAESPVTTTAATPAG